MEASGALLPADQPSSTWRKAAAVALSVLVFWTSVSMLPVYNKRVFAKGTFPYPVATATIQLAMVAFALGIISVSKHLVYLAAQHSSKAHREGSYETLPSSEPPRSMLSNGEDNEYVDAEAAAGPDIRDLWATAQPPSWLFGPHYVYKMRAIAPVGLLFGLKYGVTNLGLKLVPTGMHLLLQATDLLWTVLAAWCINGERQGLLEAGACIGTVIGSVLIGLRLNQSMEAPLIPLVVNLMSPLLMGLCIATLRRSTVLLMTPGGPLRGTMTSVELTCHKLYLSAFSAGCCAVLLEGLDVAGTLGDRVPFWEALADRPVVLLGLSGGALIVLVFQVNITWLSALTTATAVGIVGGVKVVPQWLFSLAFEVELDFSLLNLAGAALVLASAVLWTLCKVHKYGWMGRKRPAAAPAASSATWPADP